MRFTVSRAKMEKALSRAFSIVKKNSPQDVLRYVKCVVGGGQIALESTDQEVSLRTVVDQLEASSPAPVEGECLFPDRIQNLCRSADCDTLHFECGDKIEVASGFGQWSLSTSDIRDFPSIHSLEGDVFIVKGSDLKTAIQRVAYCCDVESTRYALGGVLFVMNDESPCLTLAATDSRRLAVHQVNVTCTEDSEFEPGCVVPAKAVKAALELCDADAVTIKATANQVEFSTADETVWCRRVDGRFPRYQDVIPSSFAYGMNFVAGSLATRIKQATVVTNEETNGIDLDHKDGTLTLTSQGAEVGNSALTLPVSCDTAFGVTIDARFMLEALKSVPAEASIEWGQASDNGPVVWKCDSTTIVLMPISREG